VQQCPKPKPRLIEGNIERARKSEPRARKDATMPKYQSQDSLKAILKGPESHNQGPEKMQQCPKPRLIESDIERARKSEQRARKDATMPKTKAKTH
jgi:hypothetical protein